MAGKKGGAAGGDNSKKALGQARKADAAASKAASKNQAAADAEAAEWSKGSKSNAKAEAAAAKAAEAARKKAEKDRLLAEEEASLPAKKTGNAKKAEKKTRGGGGGGGIDGALAGVNGTPSSSALNASGIDNALDALDLTANAQDKIERHPERRFKAAYTKFEGRRLEDMKDEKGLRRQQKIDQIRKEFEKHPDNPFMQVTGSYDMSKEEIAALKESERLKKEKRLGNGQ